MKESSCVLGCSNLSCFDVGTVLNKLKTINLHPSKKADRMACEFYLHKVVTMLHKRSTQGKAGFGSQPYYVRAGGLEVDSCTCLSSVPEALK